MIAVIFISYVIHRIVVGEAVWYDDEKALSPSSACLSSLSFDDVVPY